jgi:hypothetical protein
MPKIEPYELLINYPKHVREIYLTVLTKAAHSLQQNVKVLIALPPSFHISNVNRLLEATAQLYEEHPEVPSEVTALELVLRQAELVKERYLKLTGTTTQPPSN